MSPRTLTFIGERLVNTPLLLSPTKAAIIHDVIRGRMVEGFAGSDEGTPTPEASRFKGSYMTAEGGYSIFKRAANVAIITVDGSLVNRGAFVGASSGLVSYEGIAAQLEAAKQDPKIHAAIIDMNSHGGEATGMVGIAEKVRELSAAMPVVAVVNDVACSAGYGIACGASEIVVSPTSFVGSIGVVMVHSDHSGELKKKGVKVTILQKGAAKTHGNPFGPITGEGALALDKMMTVLYDQFLETVEAGRGARLNADAARNTQAGIFIGQDAVDAGIADRIGNFDAVLEELQSNAQLGTKKRKAPMADDNQTPGASGTTFTQADMSAATTAAKAEGALEASTRAKAILTCEAAAGREATAIDMAFDPDMASMSAAAVGKVLARTQMTAPEGKAKTPAEELAARASEGSQIGAEEITDKAPSTATDLWADATSDINARAL